jgi:hypothetical protein
MAGVFFDAIVPPTEVGLLRAGSARIPPGSDEATWAARYVTGCDSLCLQAREKTVIDGQPAYLQASDSEVEATLIVDGRVYLFTLFRGGDPGDPNIIPNLRGTFDALMATVDLRPQDAMAAPSASPSQRPSPS